MFTARYRPSYATLFAALISGVAFAQPPQILWTRVVQTPDVDAIDITRGGDRLVVGSGFLSCGGFPGSQCTGRGGFCVLDAKSGAVLRVEMPYGFTVNDVAFSPDGSLIGVAAGSGDIFSANTGALLRRFTAFSGSAHDAVFTPDGSRFLVGATSGYEPSVHVFDVATGTETNRFGLVDFVAAMTLSRTGRYLATADDNQIVIVFDVTNPDSERPVMFLESPNPTEPEDAYGSDPNILDIAFTPDDAAVATLSFARLNLWSIPTGALLATFESPAMYEYQFLGEFFWTAEISPDGSTLAVGGYEVEGGQRGTLNIWDLRTGALAARYEEGVGAWVKDIVFSPDSRTIYFAADGPPQYMARAIVNPVPAPGLTPAPRGTFPARVR